MTNGKKRRGGEKEKDIKNILINGINYLLEVGEIEEERKSGRSDNKHSVITKSERLFESQIVIKDKMRVDTQQGYSN